MGKKNFCIILILFMTVLVGCGKDPDVRSTRNRFFPESDNYFDSIRSDFEHDYLLVTSSQIDTNNVFINFADDSLFEGREIGTCYFIKGNNTGREILIKKSYWEGMTPACQYFLIYHELGHCALDEDHQDNYPSIMNSDIRYCGNFSLIEMNLPQSYFCMIMILLMF